MTTPAGGPGIDEPDDRDLDEGGLDLTPRTDRPARAGGPRRRWGALAVLAILGVALVVVVVQARGATVYFKNADEAVHEKDQLGTRRFRLQGTVVGKAVRGDEAMVFTVAYGGESVKVRHTGAEPALFKPGLPVVAEGHWNEAGTVFESDRLLVKHTENYTKANPDRLDGDESNDKKAK